MMGPPHKRAAGTGPGETGSGETGSGETGSGETGPTEWASGHESDAPSRRVQAVRARIRDAFAGAPPPDDDTLLHPDCLDDCDVLEFYGIPQRDSLGDSDLAYSYAAPGAFSAEAFRYYLPSFLDCALRHPDSPDMVSQSVLRVLDPGTPRDLLYDFNVKRFRLIDAAEARAIVAFLELMAELPDPDLAGLAAAALINHWYDHRAGDG